MRDYKFRGKRLDNGEWVYGCLVVNPYETSICDETDITFSRVDVDPETVGQYTGLKDKNGVEIYEWDILAVKFNPHYVERAYWNGEPDAIGEVYWDYSGFRLNCHGEKDTRYASFVDLLTEEDYHDGLLDMSNDHSEVIGNIWENPGLLKKGEE